MSTKGMWGALVACIAAFGIAACGSSSDSGSSTSGNAGGLNPPKLPVQQSLYVCGMIAEYNDVTPRPGPSLVAAVRKRLKIQGFIVSDHAALRSEYLAMAAPLVRSGQLKYREDIVEGIDNAPAAFIGLLQGKNFGKLIIKLGADPTR